MPELEPPHLRSLTIQRDQPLIAVPLDIGGREAVCYFADEAAADAASAPDSVQQALAVIGAWRDIDSEDALDMLDRIRHESEPTPPIDHL
ncbi:MAG: hypothetical protein ACKVVP_05950 [Chloroflexota bacterium]